MGAGQPVDDLREPAGGDGSTPVRGEDVPAARPPRSKPDPRLALFVLPLALGGFLGQQIAYTASRPGLEALGAIFILGFLGLLVIVTALAGLGARAARNRAGGPILAAAGLLALGGIAGNVVSPTLGLTYHRPVTLLSSGTASGTIESAVAFIARPDGFAECRSVLDGSEVAEITALALGRLGSGTLRATVDLPQEEIAVPSVELVIDGADIPEGQPQPFWQGTVTSLDAASDGTSGTVRFDAGSASEPGIPAPVNWPTTLSGSIEWACGPWSDPDATPPPPTAGAITLELELVEWVADQGAAASCETNADGSLSGLASQSAGSLQGAPVIVQLVLAPGVRTGDSVTIFVVLAGKDPPPGEQFIPNWDGRAAITELGDGARSGHAAFRDLPTGVEPSVGEPPAGWPKALTGTVSWECG